MNGTYQNIDCMELMATLPDKSVDLAIVDPEFGINAGRKNKYHAGAFTSYTPKEWDSKIPDEKYFIELERVSKERIIFGANYFTKFLPPCKNWIVWDKLQPEGVSFSMHELAFYSGEGQAKIFKGYNGGNRCVMPEKAKQYIRIHPTQKPIKLYEWLLTNYAKPNDLILDTHVGSASSLIACENLGFKYIASELDKDYYSQSLQRLQNHLAQGKLFQRHGANEIMPQKGLFE